MNNKFSFKFTIVMAVYNTEQFLREAIESVLTQDIGFTNNVQLILIDDGSTDLSGSICDEYREKFPENVIAIHKENGGVSSARNEGLKKIAGKYVNFLDSDDKLSLDCLSKVFSFFEKHFAETDVVSIPIYFFDGQCGNHILNYKFKKGNRIINLIEEYDAIQLSLSSAFIKSEDAMNMHFDTRLKYAEDAKECLQILMKKCTLGVLRDAKYYYRKRTKGEASALQQSGLNKAWYMPYLNYFSYSSLKKVQDLKGKVPLFVQYTLMYDLQWRFKTDIKIIEQVLDENEKREFLDKLYGILCHFDDQIILNMRYTYPEHRCFLLCKKYGVLPELKYSENNRLAVFVNDNEILELDKCQLKLEFMNIVQGKLIIEGIYTYIGSSEDMDIRQCVFVNGKLEDCQEVPQRNITALCLGEAMACKVAFKTEIALQDAASAFSIKFCDRIGNSVSERKNILTGKFFPVTKAFANAYAHVGEYIAKFSDNEIILQRKSTVKSIASECKLLKEYFAVKKAEAKKAIIVRCLYHIIKPIYKKEIWLLSDRINKADDNGEAFFKYLNEEKKPVNAYFVLRKDSPDYPIVAKLGKVLDYRSWKHKFYHLLADKTVSAAADEFVYNPFFGVERYYRDIMYHTKHVFLQHGIIKDDLSDWLNRYNKNLSIFITAAKPEYKSIIEGEYYYNSDVVKLTGLARYDRLEENTDKIITIMPTWRSSLGDKANNSTYVKDGVKRYSNALKDTEFFKFYNSLINHKKLLDKASSLGYRLRFMPHPNLISYIEWFDKSEQVEFCHINTKYRDIFSSSSLIVTDYSSVAFDFAYLRKPVVYAQFDKDTFFLSHTYEKGYFDYERDGFGEVEYDLESTVDRIIEYMETGCHIKERYRERIDRFFAFNDRNNCQRIFNSIIRKRER